MDYYCIRSEYERQYKDDPEYAELTERRIEWLREKYADPDLLFSYYCSDAWHRSPYSIRIHRGECENVVINEGTETIYTLDYNLLEQIVSIIKEYSELFSDENYYLEDSHYYDGWKYNIMISDGKSLFYFGDCDNLSYHLKDNHVNCKQLVSLLERIFHILKTLDIDEKYFQIK